MPYSNTNDLPDGVRSSLPSQAQDIYKEAFNSAYQQYKDPGDRNGDVGREELSHKVAWSAVKNVYHKDADGNWRKKED